MLLIFDGIARAVAGFLSAIRTMDNIKSRKKYFLHSGPDQDFQ